MTQIKQGHLEDALNALIAIAKGPFPVSARLKIVALKKCLAEHLGTFTEVRNQIVTQHGEDGVVEAEMKGWGAAVKEFEELANGTVEITPLPLAMFEDGEFGEEFDALVAFGAISIPEGSDA
jgi:hypothetical protein